MTFGVCVNVDAYLGRTIDESSYPCVLALTMSMLWVSFSQVRNCFEPIFSPHHTAYDIDNSPSDLIDSV